MIDKFFDLLIVLRQSKSKVNININKCIIFCGTTSNRRIIIYNIFCEHAYDSSVATIKPVCSWSHQWLSLTANFFKNSKICWNIKFYFTTATIIITFNHDNNTLLLMSTAMSHFFCCVSYIISWYLNDFSSSSNLSSLLHFNILIKFYKKSN